MSEREQLEDVVDLTIGGKFERNLCQSGCDLYSFWSYLKVVRNDNRCVGRIERSRTGKGTFLLFERMWMWGGVFELAD
jgi:hypothetical protein